MKEHLLEFIQVLKADSRIAHFDEAATKQVVILKLLSLLGWNIFDLGLEICPEYPISSGERVDYSLRIANINHVFIEVKKIREPLEKLQKRLESYPRKLLRCASKHGVKQAILTNGIRWHFYLPLQKNEEQNKFCTINILQPDAQDTITKFVRFLAKENIASGDSIRDVELSTNTKDKEPLSIFFPQNKLTITNIQQLVSQRFGVKIEDMRSRKRVKSIALSRQIGMYLARALTHFSLEEIGSGFGGKDHTTIMYAVEKIKNMVQKDEQFKEIIGWLENELRGKDGVSKNGVRTPHLLKQ